MDKHVPYAGWNLEPTRRRYVCRPSTVVPDWIDQRVRTLAQQRYEETMACVSLADWIEREAALRTQLLQSLGLKPLPVQVPLQERHLGTVRRDGYSVEKVTFESWPGCEVTAHLYIPDPLCSPAPAILCSVGHWVENGKMQPIMQSLAIGLVKQGFVALVYDPLDQGERREDWQCHGHLEALLVGLSQEGLSVWESMRALDYLQSRPEVDGERLGMTGASGGGMNTLYASAVDKRVKVAVPVCYVNSAEYLLPTMRGYNWVGGQDLCNQVPRLLTYANTGDICALVAPRPQLVINATRDPMFPVHGAERAVSIAQHVYALSHAPEAIALALVDAGHGYDRAMRERAYGWFRRWLLGEETFDPVEEPCHRVATPRFLVDYIDASADPQQDLPIEHGGVSSEMYCYPAGSPTSSWGAITTTVRSMAESLPPLHDLPRSPDEWTAAQGQLRCSLDVVAGARLGRCAHTPNISYMQTTGAVASYCVSFESEPGIIIPALLCVQKQWTGHSPIALLLSDRGKDDVVESGLLAQLLQARMSVLVPDLRGLGELAASEFETATTSYMLDEDLFLQRLLDVRTAVDYISDYSVIGPQIDKHRILCIGQGVAGMLALYAGAADPRIAAVGVTDLPVSYKSLIVPHAAFSASAYVFGVLRHFELSQVASLIAPRALVVAYPVDGQGQPVDAAVAENEFGWCSAAYQVASAPHRFRLVTERTADFIPAMGQWLIHQTQVVER